jgi:valyl-tRNA synthetase
VSAQRGQPGGFVGDPDIFDTWFTSSMTPQISSHWGTDAARHARLFPADVRPQGHDIIRTWAFYTIAKAMLHEDTVPWHHALISGWILDPDRKKMSKSKGNVMTPLPLIETYTADAARYWAASARLGADTAFDENVWKIGKRLVTKLFNAAKFVLSQPAEVAPISHELDRAFAAQLRELVASATKSFDAYQYAHALQETETFFWTRFTDTYLELTKTRARGEGAGTPAGRNPTEVDLASGSAVASLRLGLSVLVRLFAPVLPFITEEIWSWAFAGELAPSSPAALRSVHRAPWPTEADFAGIEAPAHAESFDIAIAALAAINKAKADAAVSVGREVSRLVLQAASPTLEIFAGVRSDVLAAARVSHCEVEVAAGLGAGELVVRAIEFAERPAEGA